MDAQQFTPVLKIIFVVSCVVVFYTYLGYALLLQILVQFKKMFITPPATRQIEPTVTVIIAAYNEEECIERKIVNTLALDYPREKLQVIVNTEGSSDRTAAIAREFSDIKLLDGDERKGKISSLNRSVTEATGEILVFTDANSLVEANMLKLVVRHFSVVKVGAVAGEKRILPSLLENGTEGEGLYWQYESLLKKLDSDLYSTVGAAGELFAMRRELWEELPDTTIIEDFVQSLKVCAKGYVVRYEPLAVAYETASTDISQEMKRKVRICAGGFQAMGMLRELFNVFRHPVVSFQFISHRVLRWSITPFSLLLMLVSNIMICLIAPDASYVVILVTQLLFYSGALAGWLLSKQQKSISILTIPFYFVFMNLSVFLGLRLYMAKEHTVLWQRSSRQNTPAL